MTYPTKAICPILLEDMRKVAVERKGETTFFSSDDIKNCMKKVIPVDLYQTIKVDHELEIKAYYAGHVLGAAMFHIRVGNESVVYTGDYNMTPDRHLGSAWIDKCRPDLLITESTYATTVRGSKRTRERDFLKKIHDCVSLGGKVIIPVFALGRAQELCILVEAYWDRMDDLRNKVPVYFSGGLTERANEYYKLFINWTNEKIKTTFVDRNMFDFKYIDTFESQFADEPGPMVLFASPGMLHAGTSLQVFKKWCHDPKNMVILPGYCVAGTVGAKVLAGEKCIQVDPYTRIDINLQVKNLSFSAHADAKGIIQLVRTCEPQNVMLVHGEKAKMAILKKQLQSEMGIPTFDPANGEVIWIGDSRNKINTKELLINGEVTRKAWDKGMKSSLSKATSSFENTYDLKCVRTTPFTGTLIHVPGQSLYLYPPGKLTRPTDQRVVFSIKKFIKAKSYIQTQPSLKNNSLSPSEQILAELFAALGQYTPDIIIRYEMSEKKPGCGDVIRLSDNEKAPIRVDLRIATEPGLAIILRWEAGAEHIAGKVWAVVDLIFN